MPISYKRMEFWLQHTLCLYACVFVCCPFMNWFPCVAHFCGLLFQQFYSTFSYTFISYRKICGKKSKQLSIFNVIIWCAVCGSVWTKIPTARIQHTPDNIYMFSKAIANVQQQKHVSIYIVPVLNYMCVLSPRPVCVPVHAERKWWVNVYVRIVCELWVYLCAAHNIDEYGSIDRERERRKTHRGTEHTHISYVFWKETKRQTRNTKI